MQKILVGCDFSSFPRLNTSMIASVDEMMRRDITGLMKKIPGEQNMKDDVDTKSLTKEEQNL